jgi:hypothetical protein
MTDLTNENIWERRFDAAIERFKDYDEYMDIPGYGVELECPSTPILTDLEEYRENLEKRFNACKQRYQGMEEHMEIPDMDLWLKLKNEIIPKRSLPKLERNVCQTFYTLDGNQLYTFDEFQTVSMGKNGVREFDPTIDEFQTASMTMNSSNYADDDRDDYSEDSIDREERRCLSFKDEWLHGRGARHRRSF